VSSKRVVQTAARLAQPAPLVSTGPAFELLDSKLRVPIPRRTAVPRTKVVRRLTGSREAPVVAVFAAPGYGKTTLLAQWADVDERPFAWVSLDERENDPVVLLTYIAAALDRIQPVPPRVFEVLSIPGAGLETIVVPRLANALSAMTLPSVLVLDDLQKLDNRECLDAIATLVPNLPAGCQIALAGRAEPALSLARLRAQRDVVDLGAADLAFDAREADLLLRECGAHIPREDVADLVRRTEGWPIGLYIAALTTEAGVEPSVAAAVTGDDAVLAEYFRSELLDRQPAEIGSFLTRTSVLDEMSGSMCDATLRETGSGRVLESLERENLLVTAIDQRQEWYRYHQLFRELLFSDLLRREPELVQELRQHAAQWCEENGRPEAALGYAQAAGDAEHAARLFASVGVSVWSSGRRTTVTRWLDWFDRAGVIDRYPVVALIGAFSSAVIGDAERAVRLASAGEDFPHGQVLADRVTPIEAFAATVRAAICPEGLQSMQVDAGHALEMTPEASPFRSTAVLVSGVANLMVGDNEAADADFADAAEVGTRLSVAGTVPIALAERSMLAIERGDWESAEKFAREARSQVRERHLDDYPVSGLVYAVSARVAIHRGDESGSGDALVRAQRLRPQLTYSLPWGAVQMRLELAHSYLALADPAGARTLVREIDGTLRHRPDLGMLVKHVDEVKAKVEGMHVTALGASTLTTAELRVLPFLATHLTLPEIGDRLSLSRHTIKSQAISAYRKLGVSGRAEAVARARELGLLEA
jgi:LuxR family transcriptional regulator, maltose regulon positive regulatory protein